MTENTSGPEPRPGILDIDPYIPGESGEKGAGPVYKLSANESPLGASPAAVAAYRDNADQIAYYPDGSATALRDAIGQRYGLNPAHIICGAGSDELLNLLGSAFLGPGDEAIYTTHGFLVYPIVIMGRGATPVVAPETDRRSDVDAILKCVTARTKMVFLANPNNPTGTYIPIDEVRRLHAGLPGNVLLVLDAAYAEYVRRNDYEAGVELVSTSRNIVMTRTFSKIYGLANLRLGWAYGPAEIISVMDRIRGPFNLTGPAIAAGIAALGDRDHLDKAIAHNDQWLGWMADQLSALGLGVTPSVGNFLLVDFAKDGPHTAAHADEELKQHGLILRRVGNYGLPNSLRLTLGTEKANRLVIDVLRKFLENEGAA